MDSVFRSFTIPKILGLIDYTIASEASLGSLYYWECTTSFRQISKLSLLSFHALRDTL